MTNPPLTPSVVPDTSDPLALAAFHRGDHADDDGQALDDYFESQYSGPPVASESEEYESLKLPETTRLLARAVTVGTTDSVLYDPVQALPADPNRKSLRIDADGPITVTSEKMDPTGGAVVVTFPWTMDAHTGAVWIGSTSAETVTVSVWAVTS